MNCNEESECQGMVTIHPKINTIHPQFSKTGKIDYSIKENLGGHENGRKIDC